MGFLEALNPLYRDSTGLLAALLVNKAPSSWLGREIEDDDRCIQGILPHKKEPFDIIYIMLQRPKLAHGNSE